MSHFSSRINRRSNGGVFDHGTRTAKRVWKTNKECKMYQLHLFDFRVEGIRAKVDTEQRITA